MRTRRTRALLVTTIAITALALLPAQAWAHVTVTGTDAARGGGDAMISFRVPTESDSASTVELKVALPTATPLASVDVQALAGWTSTVTTVKLSKPIQTDDGTITEAVSQIDWKADAAAGIKPGEFQLFTILVGQLPDTPTLTFPAIQTYSDQSVVRWTEVAAPGNTVEPEHPAPVLTLTAEVKDAAGSSPVSTSGSKPTVAKTEDTASEASVRTAIGIAIAGVLLGLAGIALAAAARRRSTAGTLPR